VSVDSNVAGVSVLVRSRFNVTHVSTNVRNQLTNQTIKCNIYIQ